MLSILFECAAAGRSHRHRRYVPAETNGAGQGIVVNTNNGCWIRSGPGTNYERIVSAFAGNQFSVSGYSGVWWQVAFNGRSGYIHSDYLQVTGRVNSNIGVNVRSGPGTNYGRVGGLGNNALVTIKGISSNWFRIDQGWVCADYIALSGSPGPAPGPSPSGQVIRQGDPRFNSNIRTWGCGFMSLCWCGGVNSIDGCNNLYNTAIRNGWMRSDCFILSWDVIKPIAGARGYRPGGRNAPVGGNEKEILECHNARTSMHFVVGNKNGGIEYDPAAPGFVSYGDHTSKRIYIY